MVALVELEIEPHRANPTLVRLPSYCSRGIHRGSGAHCRGIRCPFIGGSGTLYRGIRCPL